LDLSNNKISGILPPEVGLLFNLSVLDLSYNQLTGSIPPQIGKFQFLQYMRMSDNLLTGPIPSELGNCVKLEVLDLSRNNLSGVIPVTLASLRKLAILNLSYNSLGGTFEDKFFGAHVSIDHNMDLCGASDGLKSCDATESHKKIMALLLGFGFFCFSCLATGCMAVVCRRRKFAKVKNKSKSEDKFSIWNFGGKIAFRGHS
jgi:hypothetical protein